MKIEIGKYYIVREFNGTVRYRVRATSTLKDYGYFEGNYEVFRPKKKKYEKIEGIGGFIMRSDVGSITVKPCRKGSKRVRYGK